MELQTQIIAKYEAFRTYRTGILKDRFDLTADEFLRFIIKHGIVDRVLSRRKGLPIKRIDETKSWNIDNIEPVQRYVYVRKTQRQIKPRSVANPRPAPRYGGSVLTVNEWIGELRKNTSGA